MRLHGGVIAEVQHNRVRVDFPDSMDSSSSTPFVDVKTADVAWKIMQPPSEGLGGQTDHELVGRRVRRSFEGRCDVDGTVNHWQVAEAGDEALWHVVHDGQSGDEEDLDEDEVRTAVAKFDTETQEEAVIERAAKGRTVFEIEVQPGASAAELHSAVASRVEHQPTGRFVEIELVDGACCGSSHFVFQLPIVLRALAARGGSEEGSEESTSDGNGSSSDGEESEPAQYVGTVPPVMYGRILTELQATFHATEIQSLSLGNAFILQH
jgi:hypothetical protein